MVFPAQAGVIPGDNLQAGDIMRIPRASGGDPMARHL